MAEKQTTQLITNFYDQARSLDFSRDVSFKVTNIQPDPSFGISFSTDELVYAKAAKVPARNITNVEAPYMGLKFNLPGVVEYPDSANYNIEFYCDRDSEIRSKFEEWSRITFNDANSTANFSIPQRTSYIQLAQLAPNLDVVQTYKLVGVSIRSVGEIEYSMAEGTGAIQSFNVGLAYHYYELVKPVKFVGP
jgi:hypothetical protein